MKLKDLNSEQWQDIADYFSYVKRKMHLHKWQLYLMQKPAKKSNLAQIQPVYGRYIANIYLCREWPTLSLDRQRHTVVHELLHLVMLQSQKAVYHIGSIAPERVFPLIMATYTEGLEYGIDHVADILAPYFELPEPLIDENVVACDNAMA